MEETHNYTEVFRDTDRVTHRYHSDESSQAANLSDLAIVDEQLSPIRVGSVAQSRLMIARVDAGGGAAAAAAGAGREDTSTLFDAIDYEMRRMQDVTMETRLKRIKELGYCYAVKRELMKRLAAQRNVTKKRKMLGFFKSLKYTILMSLQTSHQNMQSTIYSINFWSYSLKRIEDHFGTGVTSYFIFLQWLIALNIPTFLVIFAFVIVPQLSTGEAFRYNGTINAANHNGTNGTRTVEYNDTRAAAAAIVDARPFNGLELLTGVNSFSSSILYYGGYTDQPIETFATTSYHMKYAYLLAICAYYLITLFILATSLSKSYKLNFIDGKKSDSVFYSVKCFASLDFKITHRDYARNYYADIKERLDEEKLEKYGRTCARWCVTIFKRLVINIIIIGLMAGAYVLTDYIVKQSNALGFVYEMEMPVVVSAINLFLPLVFSKLALLEDYSNDYMLTFLTMIRTITLNVITLISLLSFWYGTLNCSTNKAQGCHKCWENHTGQQIYRLVIIDFLFVLLVTLLSEFIWSYIVKFTNLEKPKFDIGRNTLNLIYSQSLIWLGTFFCPFLPLIMILKLCVIFFIKRVSVLKCCRPSDWRGGRINTFILLQLFVIFALCFCAVSYSIAFLHPSTECGPYNAYDTTYALISEPVTRWKQDRHASKVTTFIVDVVASTAFIVAVFVLLCTIAYYTYLRAETYRKVMHRLRVQLNRDTTDKYYLNKLLKLSSRGACIKKQQSETAP